MSHHPDATHFIDVRVDEGKPNDSGSVIAASKAGQPDYIGPGEPVALSDLVGFLERKGKRVMGIETILIIRTNHPGTCFWQGGKLRCP